MQYHEMVCPLNYLFVNDRVVVVEAIREAEGGGGRDGEVRRERERGTVGGLLLFDEVLLGSTRTNLSVDTFFAGNDFALFLAKSQKK